MGLGYIKHKILICPCEHFSCAIKNREVSEITFITSPLIMELNWSNLGSLGLY